MEFVNGILYFNISGKNVEFRKKNIETLVDVLKGFVRRK